MKLTQALGKSSLIIDGAEDNNIASNPDENGGFELGTWGFPIIKYLLDGVENKYNVRPIDECSFGVQISHRFTKEECENIVSRLKRDKKLQAGKSFKFSGTLSLTEEGYFVLIGIFSNHNDLPVYYWCD